MTDTTTHDTPPWGSDDQFTPQRAWDLIQNLRADNTKLRAARDDNLSQPWETKYDHLSKQAKVADDLVASTDGDYDPNGYAFDSRMRTRVALASQQMLTIPGASTAIVKVWRR